MLDDQGPSMLVMMMGPIISSPPTAVVNPRNSPRMPSFCKMILTPCPTPLYFFAAWSLACSSPCSCSLKQHSHAVTDSSIVH